MLSDGEPSDDELSENVSEKMLINLLGKLSAEPVDAVSYTHLTLPTIA